MGAHRTVVCLGVVTGFLTVVCIALGGILIWREVFTETTTTERQSPGFIYVNTTNLTEVREKFPGYFATPEEWELLVLANSNSPKPVLNTSRVYRRCFTNGYCERVPIKQFPPTTTTTAATTPVSNNRTASPFNRRRRQVSGSSTCTLDVLDEDDLRFHGCCISYSNLEDPSTLPTAEPGRTGDTTLVQLPGLKQYFEIQYCCQAQNCTGCQCAQTYYVTSAVILKITPDGILLGTEYVRVPGCCKCLNTQTEEDKPQ